MSFWEFLQTYYPYLLIPVISALVGWSTNILALRMTFHPLEFFGIKPYLGWQGIIPSKAGNMAAKAVDLITGKLLKIEELFSHLDATRVTQEMGPELDRVSKKIIKEVMESQAPVIWLGMPKSAKDQLHQTVAKELPMVVEEMMEELKNNVNEFFDVKSMVVETLVKDKQLLNHIFLKCGEKEFKFIERSGAYFGFIFGLFQMVAWYFYQPWWLLPLAGVTVGYLTNWLALKLIFQPLKPVKIGPWNVQGLFIKRQPEVAEEYAKIVAGQILTSPKIFDSIFYGPTAHKVASMVQLHVTRVVDLTAGSSKQLIQLITGEKKYQVIKNIAFSSFIEDLRITISQVFVYAEEALDLERTLKQRMQGLEAPEFQSFLRPVFQEDEWKLILVGAILGGLAGLIQLYVFF
ncbi:MAG: DUF445 domain-containing protein [Cyclobacteriaceae bacterium]